MGPGSTRQPRVAFLLGKNPPGASVLSEVVNRVRQAACSVTVHLPNGKLPLPASLLDSDLVVQRGLGALEMASALHLEHAGIRCCNRIRSTIALRDRRLTIQLLADEGVPVPATVAALSWTDVIGLAAGQSVVVKAVDGSIGRGLGVFVAASGRLPLQAPFAGPYIVQQYIRSNGRDYKVYVTGPQTAGLTKRWPERLTTDEIGTPFPVDEELTDLARQAGAALALEIYGVDFLFGPDGPVVVDVNPFPSFKGIRGAAGVIAAHLTAIAMGRDQS